jgi:hypothetical protein
MNCPRCGLINPETAQRCDCGHDFISKRAGKPYSALEPNTPRSKIAVGAQVAALVLAGGAVIWGCLMVHIALFPGASGEFGGYSVLLAAIVDLPVGLVSLLVGLAVKKGRRELRWTCIVVSVAVLALPFLTKAAWQSHFMRVP